MSFSRRDFLKLVSLSPLVMAADQLASMPYKPRSSQDGLPNIVVLLCDAFSAQHLSVYGYPRQTTPNIDKFAARANVYHAHYAGGTFTSSGTASLLTGTMPWTHRAIQYIGLVARPIVSHNVFKVFEGLRYRTGYAQNPWADNLLQQFQDDFDHILASPTYNLTANLFSRRFFKNDPIISYAALDTVSLTSQFLSASTQVAGLTNLWVRAAQTYYDSLYAKTYPLGVPLVPGGPLDFFTLEGVFDGLMEDIDQLPGTSTLAYYHIMPPHLPVKPSAKFYGKFRDGWRPVSKPVHPLALGTDADSIDEERRLYDEYVASLDFEFGRLIDHLEAGGVLENTFLVLTSDHGELHERGELWHTSLLMYDALVRIPLIISSPGQTTRRDVFSPTSCVDLLPTLLTLSGRPVPDWAEGRLLPGLGGDARGEEPVYVLDAKTQSAFGPLIEISVAMIKGNYKLIYYNYSNYPVQFELYDLGEDPDELKDLFSETNPVAQNMKDELLTKLDEENRPYRR